MKTIVAIVVVVSRDPQLWLGCRQSGDECERFVGGEIVLGNAMQTMLLYNWETLSS